MGPSFSASLVFDQLLELFHPVEGRASLEPLNLRLIKGVVEKDGFLAAIAVLDHCCQGLEEDIRARITTSFRSSTALWIKVSLVENIAHLARSKRFQSND